MDSYIFWVLTAAYAAHVMEEYSLDWHGWVKEIAGIDIPWGDFFVTNMAVIVLGISCGMIGWEVPALSLSFPALMIINGLFFHLLPTVVKRRYAPGTLTAALLFLPLGGYCYCLAWHDRGAGAQDITLSFLGGAVIMAYPLVLQKLKRKTARRG